jgi:eukaryotic-like serine/threonine-protein kinase
MPSYRFGDFLLDTDTHALRRGDATVSLTPKAYDLLLVLVRSGGQVLSKDEILRSVWSEEQFVEEWNLTQNIYTLRAALGDKKDRPLYIETVPRRGYRFLARVSEAQNESPAPDATGGQPSFTQLTFRRGAIFRARFAPNGEDVVYGAAYEGNVPELYLTSALGDASQSRPLGPKDANLFSVSSSGQVAASLGERNLRGYIRRGTLAVASLYGGSPPRHLLEGVQEAEWSPDGSALAVVREVSGRSRLEYPAGCALYETGGWISHPRFSREGDLIAFIDHPVQNDDRGSIAIVGMDQKARLISADWLSAQGLAWGAAGREVWFTATKQGNSRALYGVTLDGEERLLHRAAGTLTLQDIAPSGRMLLTRNSVRVGIICLAPGETRERDLSWLDWSLARDLSADGRTLLFTEAGEGGGASYGVYVRATDGSPAVRLGSGSGLALSPDGRWALSRLHLSPFGMVLLPTAAGEPRWLDRAPLNYQQWACWFPDGGRVLFTANEADKGSQLFVQNIDGGQPRCVTPDVEGVYLTSPNAISPDGASVLAVGPDEHVWVVSAGEFGAYRTLEGTKNYAPIRWSADGESLFFYERGEVPARIRRLDVATGAESEWLEIAPPDPAGVVEFLRILLTPDARSYAYTFTRDLSELYLATGLN